MKSIIIGGGKVGYYLIKTLEERRQEVTLIERNKARCTEIAQDTDTTVIWGDGTDLEILKDAGIEEVDVVAAVTGTDEENLVICQIAKEAFHIKKTIARVNNPKNMEMFKTLGIDSTVCSTEAIANLIGYELDKENYRVVKTFERGAMVLAEIVIKEGILWSGKRIQDLVLPKECVFVSVFRGEEIIYPRGDTRLLNGDNALIVTNSTVLSTLTQELFKGGNKKWGLKKRK